MLGSSYPLMDVFVSTLYLVLFVFWLILAYHVFYDLFRSRDLSGVAKTLWVLLILIFPLIGCLLYVLIRGGKMHQHEVEDAIASQKAFEDYIRHIANTKE
jgi:Phospholipase_D-nuclease N-terminal